MFDHSDLTENHIADYLKSQGYYPVVNRPINKEGKRTAQAIVLNDKYYLSIPDIDVYETPDHKNAIMRVEVKSFRSFPKEGYLFIEKKKFESYFQYFMLTEVETKIVFVIGKSEKLFGYWWGELLNMSKNISEKKYHEYTATSDPVLCYFWNPKDLHFGLDGLC